MARACGCDPALPDTRTRIFQREAALIGRSSTYMAADCGPSIGSPRHDRPFQACLSLGAGSCVLVIAVSAAARTVLPAGGCLGRRSPRGRARSGRPSDLSTAAARACRRTRLKSRRR